MGLLRDRDGDRCRGHEAQRSRRHRRRPARSLGARLARPRDGLPLPTGSAHRRVVAGDDAVGGLDCGRVPPPFWRPHWSPSWGGVRPTVALDRRCDPLDHRDLTHARSPAAAGSEGLAFLLTVATQGVSLVASSLEVDYVADWFVYIAFALWLVGIAFYLLIELQDFDHGRITTGPGDQWVFAGAVAISSRGREAGHRHRCPGRARRTGARSAGGHPCRVGCCAAHAARSLWSEFAFPRLAYSALRWATVFPVGMFAACTLVASKALGMAWMDTYFADWWVWVGLGVWAIVCAGLVRRLGRLALSRTREPDV